MPWETDYHPLSWFDTIATRFKAANIGSVPVDPSVVRHGEKHGGCEALAVIYESDLAAAHSPLLDNHGGLLGGHLAQALYRGQQISTEARIEALK